MLDNYISKSLNNLVNPQDFGIKSGLIWWATQEAKIDYGVTNEELVQIGIKDTTIYIDQSLISKLQSINEELKNVYQVEIIIDYGYRSA